MGLRVGGLVSGLDTNALIESLLTLERRPLQLAEQRKSTIENERSLFRELNTKLLALRDAAAGLDNLSTGLDGPAVEEEFLAYSASSSDESLITATASGSAAPGTLEVSVSQIAQSARRITTAFSSDSDIVANEGETLSIDFGGDDPIEITVAAGGASLVDLRGLINTDPNNDGSILADVIDDGSGFRLIISGTETGAENDIALTTDITNDASPFLDAALSQSAADAQLNVFGIPVTRSTNTVTDLIPGVTLELNGTTTTPIEIAVSIDEAAITTEFEDFLAAYNEIIDFLSQQTDVDPESGQAGPLSGDSTLRQVQTTLQQILISAPEFENNPLRSLAEAGLALDQNGRLSLNAETLNATLATNAADLRELLSGDGTEGGDGIATALIRALDPLTKTTVSEDDPDEQIPSLLATRIEGFDTRIDDIDNQIERLEARLERREELLVQQFSALEATIAQLQQQGSSLTGFQSNG